MRALRRAAGPLPFRYAIALTVYLAAIQPLSADLGVPEFEAVYKVRVSVARGEMRLDLERRDGALVYHSELEPTGFVSLFKRGVLAETSRFEYGGGEVRPLEYELVDTISENRDARYVFDRVEGELTGSYRGEPVEAELHGRTVDRLLLQIAIMSDLAHGREVQAYTVFDRAKAKRYSIDVGDTGTAETPAGEFSVVEVSYTSDDGRKEIVLQCAPELHYLPVRIEQWKDGEVESRAELVRYEFGEAAG